MRRFKYIHFVNTDTGLTSAWSCRNNASGKEMGTVAWYAPWRQYCFRAEPKSPYLSTELLEEITAFLAELMKSRGKK